jgi:uncharacterized membrane protein
MSILSVGYRRLRWLLLILAAFGAPAVADQAPEPVRGVLFHGPDCTECGELFDFLLPALFEQVGERLQLASFDTAEPTGAKLYQAAGQQGADLPLLLVGGHAFSGLMGIAQGLGDNFEALSVDPAAQRWPPLPGLEAALPRGLQLLRERVASAPEIPDYGPGNGVMPLGDRIANGLAVLTLGLMLLALWDSFRRLRQPDPAPGRNGPLVLVILVGLGISGYTAYTSLADIAPMCGVVSGCNEVQNSEYARLFGIPMGVLGLIGYAGILVTWLIGRRWSPAGGGWRWLPWGIALFGVLFSLRLTYLEPFVIGHTCIWCLGSALSITAALWLLSGQTRN